MGGCMLASPEWAAGLRDPALAVTAEQRQTVESELHASMETLFHHLAGHHGLGACASS
jgi:hypothetical protein